MTLPFYPGTFPATPRLLARFLPPLAEGVAAHYALQRSRPGDLILDPFGVAPCVALEALGLGRRVLVAGFNPVMRLAVSLAVCPPAMPELRAALTRLGDAPTGRAAADRLERQINGLYQTRCAWCDTSVTADYFDWDAERGEPVEKGYVCQACGGPRTGPTDAADREAARRFLRTGPDYHYLLNRVAALADPDRADAEDALQVYPARTLTAIGSVLLKLDGLDLGRDSDRLLAGPLIAAFDVATSLTQDRPRALTVPRRYREVNFWLALERGLGLVAGQAQPDRTVPLDQLLTDRNTAIHAYSGPARGLAARLPAGACQLVLAAVPRPNQAFWTLSALWAAWLWGPAAAEPLRAVLRRRRYDWAWHVRAVERICRAVRPTLAPAGSLVTLLAEAEPGFTAAVLAGTAAAGFRLAGTALRADTAEMQADWRLAPDRASAVLAPEQQMARALAAMQAALHARGEPSRWPTLQWAAGAGLSGRLAAEGDEALAQLLRAVEAAATSPGALTRLGAAPGDELPNGLWWLADGGAAAPPLAERVELEVWRRLSDGAPVDERDLLPLTYAVFPGAQTPGLGLVRAVLASYGLPLGGGYWQLRAEDQPEARAADLAATLAHLRALATRSALEPAGDNPLAWHEDGRPIYIFVVQSTATLAGPLLGALPAARQRFLVLPGGRVALAEHCLRRDPRLKAAFESGGWNIIKFRHVRRMAADAAVTRATLAPALAGDPVEAAQQLALPEGPV
ncbi:MAG: hypothetical protein IT317_20060 [Anaerolineales bacterium]|nr:hypothetical protein [Anaerolineales bacterium]